MKGSDFPLLLASELSCGAGACLSPEPSLAPPWVSARTAACRLDGAQWRGFPWGAEAMVTGASVQDLTPQPLPTDPKVCMGNLAASPAEPPPSQITAAGEMAPCGSSLWDGL